jgi:hypothetical protein
MVFVPVRTDVIDGLLACEVTGTVAEMRRPAGPGVRDID